MSIYAILSIALLIEKTFYYIRKIFFKKYTTGKVQFLIYIGLSIAILVVKLI